MAKSFPVPEATGLVDGQMTSVEVDGLEILIACVEGNLYAVGNRCTHARGKLSEGKLVGFVIICPVHGSQFDVRTGQVVRWTKFPRWISRMIKVLKPAKPLPTYEIKSDSGNVLVTVE